MKPFTTAAVCIFTLVSLTHLCRIFTSWEVTVAGTAIPMWASYLPPKPGTTNWTL